MAKAMKEIARDVEYGIINNATATEGDGDTAGIFGGIPAFNIVNVCNVDDGVNYTGDLANKLSETAFNDAVQKAWVAGGNPEVALVSGTNKRLISGWTASSTKMKDMAEKKLTAVIDVNFICVTC
jgi:hypothetical protein